jgi:hypothetical protein
MVAFEYEFVVFQLGSGEETGLEDAEDERVEAVRD